MGARWQWVLLAVLTIPGIRPVGASDAEALSGRAAAVVDLATREGVALMSASWRYRDVEIVTAQFLAPGADGQPSMAAVPAYDYAPKAGGANYRDDDWEVIDPTTLRKPRGHGRVAFNWYRIALTVPERVGDLATAGTTLVFETQVDDYAEVWVDGEITYAMQDSGGPVVGGWNARNRLVVGRDVKPGQRIQLAVFGMNGPVSRSPTNYIFVHYARLEFHRVRNGPAAMPAHEANLEVIRHDPEMDRVVGRNPKLFKLAEGFRFTEGPVWVPGGGYLLFSDPNANTMYRYGPGGELSVFRSPSGYDGPDVGEYGQPGSNGIALDAQGRVVFADHGNRRIARLEQDGGLTVLADRYRGKRLNSPNDLVVKSDGAVYFTDPPFGLPKFFDDPRKELAFSGVYRWKDGETTLLSPDLSGPNGIAFSPGEEFLYVGNWDDRRKVVMRYPVREDGTTGPGEVFFDMTGAPGEEAIDGLKVDRDGRLYVSGPGGLWVLAPDGRHLGTIVTPKHAHNLAWGDDGKTLYLTAQSALYRLPLRTPGDSASR